MARTPRTRIALILVLGSAAAGAGYFAGRWPALPVTAIQPDLAAAGGGSGAAQSAPPGAAVSVSRRDVVPALTLTGLADQPAMMNSNRGASADPDQAEQRTLDAPKLPAETDGENLAAQAAGCEAAGQAIDARRSYALALRAGLRAERQAEVRQRLLSLSEKTLLGARVWPGETLAQSYTVQPGDTLGRIAREYQLTPELIARVNGLPSADRISLGQQIKVLQGPFRAEIYKRNHLMIVYLQDTPVRSFAVGLGMGGSTPSGEWRIKNKLVNPTYYAPDKSEIIAAGDPQNPLGERWLGFEGLRGEALGQEAYGVHGTIEPQSIGQDASKGCVRMHNEDVELLYDMLVVGVSTVMIFE